MVGGVIAAAVDVTTNIVAVVVAAAVAGKLNTPPGNAE